MPEVFGQDFVGELQQVFDDEALIIFVPGYDVA